MVEHNVVVMLRCFQSRRSQINFMCTQFLILVLLNLFSESVWDINFFELVEDCDTGDPGSIAVRMKYLFAF